MAVRKVTILGADGNLGPSILSALVKNGFDVTVLKRETSKSPQTHHQEKRIPDAFDSESLIAALRGQDAIVVTIKATQVDLQKRVADACVLAGVKRYIPADFGSCDSSSPLTQELLPLYSNKTTVREYLQSLAEKHPGKFEWTSIVCGHFFDWSLQFLHLWPEQRRADVLDDGEWRFSVSTLEQIGRATVNVLSKWDDDDAPFRNRMIYVQSFCVSQNQVIAAYEKATGVKWDVTKYNSKEFQGREMEKVKKGDKEAIEEVVWLLGTIDANWEARDTFFMKELDLAEESIDHVVKRVVDATLLSQNAST